MWKRKLLLITLLSLCWLLLPAGSCSAAEPETVTMSISDYQSLKQNFLALKQANEQQQQLSSQLKSQLSNLGQLQGLSSQDLQTLKAQLTDSQQKVKLLESQLDLLEKQLQQAKQASQTAQSELASANQSLNELSKAIKSERRAAQRRETALKAVIVGLVAYELTK